MGFWLYRKFQSRKLFTNRILGTEVFNLPRHGIISNLCIILEATPGDANIDNYLAQVLTKVEVIGNGSTVIQSLDGGQIQASMCFDDHVFPPDEEFAPSGWAYGHFDLRFGRFLADELYALDCTRWDTLELKITYDLKAGGVISTTGFTENTGYLRVIGLYSPDGAGLSPVGYIKKEEKKTFATTVGGSLDLDLPSDYPYRRIMLFTNTDNVGCTNTFYRTTINVNEGARKVLDRAHAIELQYLQVEQLKAALKTKKRFTQDQTAVTNIHRPLGWFQNAIWQPLTGSGYELGCPSQIDPYQVQFPIASRVLSGDIIILGYLPWGAQLIDLEFLSGGKHGSEAMMAAWGATEKDNIDLEIEENVIAADCSIALEQYASH